MILGLASWGFRETPLEEQLKFTQDMGLTLLELSIANIPTDVLDENADERTIRHVKELYADYGVRPDCTATGCDFTQPSEDACLADLEKLKKVIKIAGNVGAKTLRIFSGFSPVAEVIDERWDRMIACLREAISAADAAGIILVMETHGGVRAFDNGVEHFASVSTEPDCLKRMLAELPPSFMLLYDPANLAAVGAEQPHEVYSRYKDRVKCLHLKDFAAVDSTGIVRPVTCGEGKLSWDMLMNTLKDYTGPALIEYENPEDIKEGCRRSIEFLNNRSNCSGMCI